MTQHLFGAKEHYIPAYKLTMITTATKRTLLKGAGLEKHSRLRSLFY